MHESSFITLCLAGDVMTGRGIDQVLPHPSDPILHESWVNSAEHYVALAEEKNGPLHRPVSYTHIWGDVLEELNRVDPDVWVTNLETSVTRSERYWKGKNVHYRMHPENIPCLTAAGIDVCALANNHVLDWGYAGLAETLHTLRRAGIRTSGAGPNLDAAAAPAVVEVARKGRVVVFAYGMPSSGIPSEWAATEEKPGIHLLTGPTAENALKIREQVARVKLDGDVVVASIHWGSNWGYHIPHAHAEFAHALIDEAGIDLIHGHSSHHVKAIEVYHDRLILYGAGDFLDDYEGIGGYEDYRGDLVMMYFATLDPGTGMIVRLNMSPMHVRRFSVNRASTDDVRYLHNVLLRECGAFGTSVMIKDGAAFELRWR